MHLVVAGDGEADYVERLRRIARGTAAESAVHWVGWLEDAAKFEALAEADLFVLSSFQENFGIGAVESMACGTPVLLSHQVGLASVVRNAGAGWLVNLDGDGLRDGLVDATDNPTELAARGDAARELVRERFTWPQIAGEWMAIYERLSSERSLLFPMSAPITNADSAQGRSAPLPPGQVRRMILVCPDLHEVGGIGMVSRLGLRALQSYSAATGCHGEVWSFGNPAPDDSIPQAPNWQVRYAHGRKARATLWGLKAGLGDARHTLVVVMHLHLAPLAVPLVKRGAHLAVFLHGIEAWVPLGGLRRARWNIPCLCWPTHSIRSSD